MFRRFKTRYYSITLMSMMDTLGNPCLFGVNCDITIRIRGKVSREIILKTLQETKDESIQKAVKEFPLLVAWSEVDEF